MHIDIMRIKVSTEAAFISLSRNARLDSPDMVARYMLDQIDRWMEDGYVRPRTRSDILDHRHRKLLRREKP